MTRLLLVLACAGCAFGTQFTALLPEGFRGWACVETGMAGAPPLGREGEAFAIRFGKPGEVVKTSDKASDSWAMWQAWFEVNGKRWPLPDDVDARRQTSSGDRFCVFFGTEDEADAADGPPGIDRLQEPRGLPAKERQALVALYEATGGKHWKHRVGWLGPPGTECKWHGVECNFEPGERVPGVFWLSLDSNNLAGAIPEAVCRLAHLKRLIISGNRLVGRLPEPLLRRWQTGDLEISAEMPLFTGISEIDFESSASALLCWRHRIVFRSDASATLYTTRCRDATPDDRTTYCEVKQGRAWALPRLAWLIEKNGFYGFQGEYSRLVTDSGFEKTRVIRDGKRYQVVDYAGGGPLDLWTIEAAIEGVAADVEWEKTTTQPECPRW
jgi:hypothetical protein